MGEGTEPFEDDPELPEFSRNNLDRLAKLEELAEDGAGPHCQPDFTGPVTVTAENGSDLKYAGYRPPEFAKGGPVEGGSDGTDGVPPVLAGGCDYILPGTAGTVESPAPKRQVPVVIDGVFHGMREE